METILYIATFVFGTIIGSFLNVVIYRYNTGKGVSGRSMCLTCSKPLEWNHLVPVLSYVFLMGKCAFCKTKISIQYPTVEVITGLAFLLLAYKISFIPILALYLIAFSLLLVIAVYDYRHKIIPDGIVYAFIVLSLFRPLIEYYEGRGDITYDILSGLGISAFFASLFFVSGGRWMGFGDAKLALGIGWLLPFCQNASAIILAFFVGSIIGITLTLFAQLSKITRKQFEFDREIPFAPFLIFSAFATLVFNFDVIGMMLSGMVSCLS